ncbi:hypothetical protein Sjap_023155 [Stephania japonica]|uniref:C2H2-type domain-containing protein n=1 Tax=Stephania japonica TaxID=461633 RepID=A0AAP0EIC4_9MAGN
MSTLSQEFDGEDGDDDVVEVHPISNLSQSLKGRLSSAHGGNDSKMNCVISKKKRNHPGNPGKIPYTFVYLILHWKHGKVDPDAEVVALSPRTLMATNRYICEVCHKGFQRDQNLQLHRRGHNLPWKLKQRPTVEVKKRVYICPEPTCIHHNPNRALGDLTGIKKHFCRKHGEKKWKCDKCSKRYAVQSDWKAHSKICGTREYKCDCGTLFSRKDSFVTHRAFCDALAEENYKVNQKACAVEGIFENQLSPEPFSSSMPGSISFPNPNADNLLRLPPLFMSSNIGLSFPDNADANSDPNAMRAHPLSGFSALSTGRNLSFAMDSPSMSATALLQTAAEMGSKMSDNEIFPILLRGFTSFSPSAMRSHGSIQEVHAPVSHQPLNPAMTTNLYLGEQNAMGRPWDPRDSDRSGTTSTVFHGALFNSALERSSTVDFLGVEPGGLVRIGEDKSCETDSIGLEYSQGEQSLQPGWLSYHC